MYKLGAIHARCVPDTASAYWVPSLKVTATTRGRVVPLSPPNVSCVQPVVWASELTCTRVFTTLMGRLELKDKPKVPDTKKVPATDGVKIPAATLSPEPPMMLNVIEEVTSTAADPSDS
jgi:hypothetical protein